MKIKECAYFHKEDETCELFRESHRGFYSFPSCEWITISKCPYKQYVLGMIDKEDLNKKITEAING